MGVLEMECGPKCKSRQHAQQLITAITKGNLRQCQLFISKCHNAVHIADKYGKTILHQAASCGKWELVEWLLSEKGADVGTKDAESHWNALHRSLFYGQLTSARRLIAYGANMQARDREGLTALDICMADRLPHVEFVQSGLNEVFTWGDNANFTLGHDTENRRKYPEAVEIFRKQGISLKQVVMCKYHSVFLSTAGYVYTCGHGRGGRLGHGSEQTCLEPMLIPMKDEVCCDVSGSKDHTVMLMESGTIYSCGLNDCHQLGQVPYQDSSLVPKPMNCKSMKGKVFTGVLAKRYHTVLYNKQEIFTLGLNAGQLGHQKNPNESVIKHPRQVSSLIHKDTYLEFIAASDAAIVVATAKGDVYALHEYQCRKIISKQLDIVQIAVAGGHLDASVTQCEPGGSDLLVAILTKSGKIYLWQAGDPVLKRCAWMLRRSLFITHMALNMANLAFVTKEGEAFVVTLPKKLGEGNVGLSSSKESVVAYSPLDMFSLSLSDLVDRDGIQELNVERVALVHRATCITTDSKGRNMAVLQAQANSSLTEIPGVQSSTMAKHFIQLLDEADTTDSIHDVLLQVGSKTLAAHKYILAFQSEYFQKLFAETSEEEVPSHPQKSVINIENVNLDIFQQLLKFLYTDTCDLLTKGHKFVLHDKNAQNVCSDNVFMNGVNVVSQGVVTCNGHKTSAFAVHQSKNKKGKKKGKGDSKTQDKHNTVDSEREINPIKMLLDLAKRFGVKNLAKRLEAVQYINGTVEKVPGKHLAKPKLRFYRTKNWQLYDVCIQAEDGSTIQCHKCVLVARLEYFRSMLASGWIETSNTEALILPVPGDILRVIIDYLYVDDASVLKDSQDAEFLCNVLVMADQLLIERLKEMCEVTITSLMTLKNACELLEFSSTYNASQLKVTCQQFITINMAALLEARSLDVLSIEVLDELSNYYKDTICGMRKRCITPDGSWPDRTYLEQLEFEHADMNISSDANTSKEEHITKKTNKGKKKRTRTKSTEEYSLDKKQPISVVHRQSSRRTDRQISVSSETGFNMELEEVEDNENDVRELNKEEPWTAIRVRVPSSMPSKFQVKPSMDISSGDGSGQAVTSPAEISPNKEFVDVNSTKTVEQSQMIDTGIIVGSPVGLRDIMAQQKLASKEQHQVSSTQHSAKKSGRLSQKERKKLALKSDVVEIPGQATGSCGGSGDVGTSPGTGAKPKAWASPTNAWGPMTSIVESFKDLMLTQEESPIPVTGLPSAAVAVPAIRHSPSAHNSSMSPAHIKMASSPQVEKTVSWGLQMPNPRKSSTVPESPNSPSSSSPITLENPWQKHNQPISVSPVQSMPSFTEIMKDEKLQTETLARAANKPLALIQIEEQAIQELLEYYKVDTTYDQYITVERVHTTLAKPTWAATQRQKES